MGGAGLRGTWAPARCSLQHWLLWAKPHSVGNISISCHQEENGQHNDCAGMARHHPLCHPLLAAGPQRLRGAPIESPWLATACKHVDTDTHAHRKGKIQTLNIEEIWMC